MAGNSSQQELYPRVPIRVPFAEPALYRDSGTKDQRYVNVISEHIKTDTIDKHYLIKRPGLENHSQPSGGAATGRGLHYWPFAGTIYSIFDDKIYNGTTDLGVTLSASTGRIWWAETPEGFGGGTRLLVSDGTKLYAIQSDNTVTTISTSSDSDFPTSNLGPIEFFNSYIFLAKSNTTIWNSDVDTFADWGATSFLSAEMYSDGLEAIARQRDYLVALGKESVEFLFDNANTPGSPLERRASYAIRIGIETKNSLSSQEDNIAFVGKSTSGIRSVWLMKGLESIERISTPPIERVLIAEGTNITNCSAFLLRTQGHFLYVLNLATSNRTFVYDIGDKFWTEWASSAGNEFNCVAATSDSQYVYMQDATNGRIYKFKPDIYQDSSSNFTVTLQTDKMDYGLSNLKFCPRYTLVADTTTGNYALSFADDDATTFSTARNIDLSKDYKTLTQLGTFRRRTWKGTYADNYPLRVEAYELELRQGNK